MLDIIAIGELLIDMTPIQSDHGRVFQPNPGGAPCNVLAMAQSLGSKTGFIGQVGKDAFGMQLKETLEDAGINTSQLIMGRFPTTLAFVHLDDHGDRSFSFYRDHCADVMLDIKSIDFDFVRKSKVLHFGSLSFTSEPVKSTVLELLEFARKEHIFITYDPNYRPALWTSEEEAIEGMMLGLKYADAIKLADDEALLLTGEKTIEAAAQAIFDMGISLVCITLGNKGSYYHVKEGTGLVGAFESQVLDTTGAGDSFFGAVIHYLLGHDLKLNIENVEAALQLGNACASLVIEKRGGIPAIPSIKHVLERLQV